MTIRVCFVVASPMTFNAFIMPLIEQMAGEVEVTVLSNHSIGDPTDSPSVRFLDVPIRRRPSLRHDFAALFHLASLLRRHDFDIVHSLTPKAGLLAAVAGSLVRQPVLIHTFTGQVWATRTGVARFVLKALDRLTARLATHPLADSPSQAYFLASQGFRKPIAVIGAGSVSGVDPTRFLPCPTSRSRVRSELKIDHSELVFVFVGRLTRDKGVLDLAEAWKLADLGPGHRLIVVGPDEQDLGRQILDVSASVENSIVVVGSTTQPEAYLAASDVFCLPSYREGFGTTVLEAAAAGLPAIVSTVYGLSDAVVPGVTALVHPPGDVEALSECLRTMASEGATRTNMGAAARERALADFAVADLASELLQYYRSALKTRERR